MTGSRKLIFGEPYRSLARSTFVSVLELTLTHPIETNRDSPRLSDPDMDCLFLALSMFLVFSHFICRQ